MKTATNKATTQRATDLSDADRVLRYFEALGYEDFAWVADISAALEMPWLRVSYALDALIARQRVEEHRFTNRPLGYRLLPAPKAA